MAVADSPIGKVRPPAVAGSFYPAGPQRLRTSVESMLQNAVLSDAGIRPRLFIVPHAGYVYAGPVAAAAYRLVPPATRRLVVVGPSHFVPFPGLATPGVEGLATPLGVVPCDAAPIDAPGGVVTSRPEAHAREHSVEVQLPFCQVVLEQFSALTLLTGDVGAAAVAEVLDDLIQDDEVVVLISSDLSHYHDYDTARARDSATAEAILAFRPEDLAWGDACGLVGVQAGLLLAGRHGWTCSLLDLRSSGDTAGDRDSVVGYGSFVMGPGR